RPRVRLPVLIEQIAGRGGCGFGVRDDDDRARVAAVRRHVLDEPLDDATEILGARLERGDGAVAGAEARRSIAHRHADPAGERAELAEMAIDEAVAAGRDAGAVAESVALPEQEHGTGLAEPLPLPVERERLPRRRAVDYA